MNKQVWVDHKKTLINKEPRYTKDFVQIPFVILRNPGIGPLEKVLYMNLVSYAWYVDEVFPGQDRLAWDLGVNIKTVRKGLVNLKKVGLISWRQQGFNKPNIYTIEPIPQVILAYKADKDLEFSLIQESKKNDTEREEN